MGSGRAPALHHALLFKDAEPLILLPDMFTYDSLTITSRMSSAISLGSALRELGSAAGRLKAAAALQNAVYGSCHPSQVSSWRPRPYTDDSSRCADLAALQAGAAAPWATLAGSKQHSSDGLGLCIPQAAVPCCRYLWTDAFGVVNYVSLAAVTGDCTFLRQADALITGAARRTSHKCTAKLTAFHARLCSAAADVHNTLGRTRDGRRQLGAATAEDPTRGGLRIGKAHEEGHPDGDGQYFHYLTQQVAAASGPLQGTCQRQALDWRVPTVLGRVRRSSGPVRLHAWCRYTALTQQEWRCRWAFALNRMGLATGDPRYNRWAVQVRGGLAGICRAFVNDWAGQVDRLRPGVAAIGCITPTHTFPPPQAAHGNGPPTLCARRQ